MNEDVAGNRAMIKAFTDTERLNRFARDNKLVDANDGVTFISMGVKPEILNYLEQFIPMGVHGIHFNADIGSTGFFAPLAQMRPIYEYIQKH